MSHACEIRVSCMRPDLLPQSTAFDKQGMVPSVSTRCLHLLAVMFFLHVPLSPKACAAAPTANALQPAFQLQRQEEVKRKRHRRGVKMLTSASLRDHRF